MVSFNYLIKRELQILASVLNGEFASSSSSSIENPDKSASGFSATFDSYSSFALAGSEGMVIGFFPLSLFSGGVITLLLNS